MISNRPLFASLTDSGSEGVGLQYGQYIRIRDIIYVDCLAVVTSRYSTTTSIAEGLPSLKYGSKATLSAVTSQTSSPIELSARAESNKLYLNSNPLTADMYVHIFGSYAAVAMQN